MVDVYAFYTNKKIQTKEYLVDNEQNYRQMFRSIKSLFCPNKHHENISVHNNEKYCTRCKWETRIESSCKILAPVVTPHHLKIPFSNSPRIITVLRSIVQLERIKNGLHPEEELWNNNNNNLWHLLHHTIWNFPSTFSTLNYHCVYY